MEIDFDLAIAEARRGLVQSDPDDPPVTIMSRDLTLPPVHQTVPRPLPPALNMSGTPEVKPDILYAETWQAVVDAVGRGMSLARACALCGASLTVVKRVIKADPAKARAISRAKAELISGLTNVVVDAAIGDGEERGPDWRAATWLLPKLDPSLRENKKPSVSITNQTLNVGDAQQLKQMSKEELRAFLGS